MKSVLAAIARVLAAMATWAVEKVWVAGQWIWAMVRKPTPALSGSMDLPSVDPTAAAEAARAAQAVADYDMEMGAIRTVAAHMRSGFVPPQALVDEIDEQTMAWLCALTPEMLNAVVKAQPQDLRAHVMGRKSLRGVLINDGDTVKLFTRPNNGSVEDDEPEWAAMPTPARYA